MDERLKSFENEEYLNLETLRDSGESVSTPVWFALDGGRFFIRTLGNSYKVKRIKGNPAARIAPCEGNGDLKGEWTAARALLGGAADLEHAQHLLNQKYGFRKRLFDLIGRLMGRKWVTIVVELA